MRTDEVQCCDISHCRGDDSEYGFEAEQAALELAAFLRDLGECERQAEWLRVRTAIVRLRDQSGMATDAVLTAAL